MVELAAATAVTALVEATLVRPIRILYRLASRHV